MSVARVLQVHTLYRHAGGEDQVVEAERLLLEDAGVEVRQVIFDNAELREARSLRGDLALAAGSIWSAPARRRVAAEVAAFRPDVMHVHNTFAAASPSVYAAANDAAVPVVQTLHNYRLVCPAATAFRDGAACTDCVGLPVPVPGVVHACVRGSLPQSATMAALLAAHRTIGTWRRRVDAWIALTEFQRDLLVRGGVPARRLRVVPNFVVPDPGVGPGPRSGLLFVGRLTVEKGVTTLVGAATRAPGLVRVVGTGPLESLVAEADRAGAVAALGRLEPAAVRAAMQVATAVVVPSLWFEGFPMVVAEAFATGTPVIASRIGSLAEIVDDGVTGLLVTPGDAGELADRLRWATANPDALAAMGAAARERYESRYRGPVHLRDLLAAYAVAADNRRRRARSRTTDG